MSKKMDRRGFLKALPFLPKATLEEIKETKEYEKIDIIRPPYSSSASNWELCRECDGKCIKSCEEKILYRLEDGTPYVSFSGNGCTFCKKCAESCEFGVLSLENDEKILADIHINTKKCFAWNGTMCFSCKEPCLDNAVVFEGIFKPKILSDLCTGCGFCLPVCPTGAIEIKPIEVGDV
jgi:ferredoxin-type protein NapF